MNNLDETTVFDLQEYEEILAPLVEDFKVNIETSESTFLRLGDELVEIESKLKTKDKDTFKKAFVQLKKDTANRLEMNDVRNIDKVVRVARNPTISHYRYKDSQRQLNGELDKVVLPTSWTILYQLTRLKKSEIDDIIEHKLITKDMKRDELSILVDEKLGKVKKPKSNVQKLVITREVEEDATEDELRELREILHKLNWKMKDFKETPSIPVVDTPAKLSNPKEPA